MFKKLLLCTVLGSFSATALSFGSFRAAPATPEKLAPAEKRAENRRAVSKKLTELKEAVQDAGTFVKTTAQDATTKVKTTAQDVGTFAKTTFKEATTKKAMLSTVRKYKLHRIALAIGFLSGQALALGVLKPKNDGLIQLTLILMLAGSTMNALIPNADYGYSDTAARASTISAALLLGGGGTKALGAGAGYAAGDLLGNISGVYLDDALDAQIEKAEQADAKSSK